MEAILNEKEKQLILNDKVKTVFRKLAWPSLIGMFLHGLNNFLDGIFVGHFINEKALAGVSIAFMLSQILIGVANMVGNGAGTMLSIMLGANDRRQMKFLLGNVNTLSLFFSVVLLVPCYIFSEDLMRIMGGRGEILEYGAAYFRHAMIGAFFWIHSLTLINLIRGEGKIRLVTLITAVGLAFDVLLKYLLIKVFGFGIYGAAWATNTTMIFYSIICIIYFTSGKSVLKSSPFTFHFDKALQKQILIAGFSNFIFLAMGVAQGLIVFNMISKYGNDMDMGFYSTTYRLFFALIMPPLGIMKALQPVIGMNYGARQYERVKKMFIYFLRAAMLIILPFWLFAFVFPEQLIGTMLKAGSYSQHDIQLFRIAISTFLLQPVTLLAMAFLPSVGKGKEAGIVAMLQQIVLYIPAMLILPAYYGVGSIYFVPAVIQVIAFGLIAFMIRKEFKRFSGNDNVVIASVA
ncbi:MAG: MATE family efflux transporter [Bacteroidia bacterium]